MDKGVDDIAFWHKGKLLSEEKVACMLKALGELIPSKIE